MSAAMLLWAFGGGMAMTDAATGLVRQVAGHAFVVEGWRRTVLAAGAQLHVGDTLQAGRDGPFQVTFAGDAILTVAAGARITLTHSVFGKAADAGAIREAFCEVARDITGFVLRTLLPKARIVSPPPSIGVRG